jgi:hypothetical protein
MTRINPEGDMHSKPTLSLIIAATVGGGAVHLALQACGSVSSSSPDAARADSKPADSNAAAPPIVTDWVAYTPTLTSARAGAAVGNATTTGSWRRIGDTLELHIATRLSGTPTGTGCADYWQWSLPSGLSIDTTKSLGRDATAGVGDAYQPGVHAKVTITTQTGTTIVAVGDPDCLINATTPFAFGANGFFSFEAAFPISGWTATQ